jgi:hypothetical protein
MDGKQGSRAARAGWVTRAAVARMLGVSLGWVRNREGEVFHPSRGEDGAWYFDPKEVEAARALVTQPARAAAPPETQGGGELAARLFPLFERRMSFAQIVVETRLPPATVRELFREWRTGFGGAQAAAPSSDDGEDTDDRDDERSAAEDERVFTEWEKEMRTIDREQERLHRQARRRPGSG